MDSAKVKSTIEGYYNSYVKDLEWMTKIDSKTGNIEGSRKIAAFLKEKIAELGGTYELRDNGRGAHVIARFKGNGKKRFLLVVHTDTVLGPSDWEKPFALDDKKIARGPGVGDCKASAVQMLYLLKAFKDLAVTPYSELVVFFDSEEEGSSADEFAFAEELAKQVDYSIVCDTGRPGWGVCTKRKGSAKYRVEIKGISGHAGNSPQAAANAVIEAGNLISRISKLASPLPDHPEKYQGDALKAKGINDHGQFIPDNSVNIAVVGTNNTKINVIPDNAFIEIEVRCYLISELERIQKEIHKICETPTVLGTTVTVTGGIKQGPMEKTDAAKELVETYKKVVKDEYKADIVEWVAGGLTIGNVTARFVPTIDALGVDVDPLCEHTLREYCDLNTFAPRTVALFHLIDKMNK